MKVSLYKLVRGKIRRGSKDNKGKSDALMRLEFSCTNTMGDHI